MYGQFVWAICMGNLYGQTVWGAYVQRQNVTDTVVGVKTRIPQDLLFISTPILFMCVTHSLRNGYLLDDLSSRGGAFSPKQANALEYPY